MSESFRLIGTRALLGAVVLAGSAAAVRAETRALSLYNTHTQERATIVFKRDGQYDPAGLQELHRMLRDWRRNEVTKMDPQLFDLIWDVYRESGSSQPIHIVSGYRSPATNNALRSRSRGVAKFSQHMLGKAMDFYLPDVPLDRLRAIGMKKQFGGVGFYPTSGSPFVHMDTGSVRAWPRMSREQLVRLFPDGKTAHLPADGAPLPRYEEALAEVQARKGRGETSVAGASGGGRSLLAALFGRGAAANAADEEDEGGPIRQQVVRQGPPQPGSRPAPSEDGESYTPPRTNTVAAAAAQPAQPAAGSLVALPVPTPAPRAPGSLVAQAGAPPAGWVQGPATAASAGAGLQPIAVPIPNAKPGAATVVAGAVPLPADFVQPRAKPGSGLPSAAPASAAIAMATGAAPPAAFSASMLGYAALPAPKPAPDLATAELKPNQTTAQRPPSGGVLLAALPPATAGGALTATDARPTLAAARPAAKGDRIDPLARFVARTGERPEGRLLDTVATTRTAAFGELSHPDQERLPQLLIKPGQLIVSGFGQGAPELRSDRFAGPAVAALPLVRTE